LVARGFSVFPVPYARTGGLDGKTPVIPWKDYQSRRPTDAELVAWFATPQNIAVVTGAISGIVIVDVDGRDAAQWVKGHLPPTPWQTITGKGAHFWYRHPGRAVRSTVRLRTDAGRLALDVRGDGGYVMAPPSVHASGVYYQFAGDWRVPREQLPCFSSAWLPSAPPERVTKQGSPLRSSQTADALKRARAYLAAVPRPEIGYGSDTATFVAACRLVRGFALSESDAEYLLWEWAGGRPGWTREWVIQKVRSARDNGSEQIGALL
jgi:hypothetical protein